MNRQLKSLIATSLLFAACTAPQNHDGAGSKNKTEKDEDFKIVLNSKPQSESGQGTQQKSDSAQADSSAAQPNPSTPPTSTEAVKPSVNAAPALKWSYTGALGPEFWGDLDSQYSACKSGETQSPIDLKWKKPSQKKMIKVDYQPSLWRVVANDLSLKVEFSKSNFMTVDGKAYELQDALFHVPGEHTIAGKSYDGEIELIHRSTTGEIAILSVMLRKGGGELAQLNSILEKVGAKNQVVEVTDTMLDPSKWLPKSSTFYQYQGSLTFPPCTEGVLRVVYNTALHLSDTQFEKLSVMGNSNARPVQTLKAHKVLNF